MTPSNYTYVVQTFVKLPANCPSIPLKLLCHFPLHSNPAPYSAYSFHNTYYYY